METILVIGINGAIGKAVAGLFSEKGIRCLGTTSRIDQLSELNKELFYLDLCGNLSSLTALIQQLPVLNGIVFCSGFEPQYSLDETEPAFHRRMMDIHISGPLFVIQSLKSKIQKEGSIIFISSIAAQKGSYDPSYAIAKSAVIGMTRTLARELAVDSIRVNAIAPGLVKDTPVHKRMTPDFREKHLQHTLLQQLTTTRDCAEAIYFLYMQKQITGQQVHINGGQYFGN